MNLLQSIPESKFGPVLVTLNPPFEPAQDKTLGSWDYEHPYMSAKVRLKRITMANSELFVQSIAAQIELPQIQNKRGFSFVGACKSVVIVSTSTDG